MIIAKIKESVILEDNGDLGTDRISYIYIPKDAKLSEWMPQKFEDIVKPFMEDKILRSEGGRIGRYSYVLNRTDLDYMKFMEFCTVYYEELGRQMEKNPDHYLKTLAATYTSMKYAIAKGEFDKDSLSFKATCKHLGIKHTYKAINAYLKGE